MLTITRASARADYHEALFTLGGAAPRSASPPPASRLTPHAAQTGPSAASPRCARLVLDQNGLLPHTDAGPLYRRRDGAPEGGQRQPGDDAGVAEPRPAGAPRRAGQAPENRLATLEGAGRLWIPFTTGILIGIGETRRERMEALTTIRRPPPRDHVQEVIVQNFLPKPGAAMHQRLPARPPGAVDAIALARLVLPHNVHVQTHRIMAEPASVSLLRHWGRRLGDLIYPITTDT